MSGRWGGRASEKAPVRDLATDADVAAEKKCPRCKGTGSIALGRSGEVARCPMCKGTGKVPAAKDENPLTPGQVEFARKALGPDATEEEMRAYVEKAQKSTLSFKSAGATRRQS